MLPVIPNYFHSNVLYAVCVLAAVNLFLTHHISLSLTSDLHMLQANYFVVKFTFKISILKCLRMTICFIVVESCS